MMFLEININFSKTSMIGFENNVENNIYLAYKESIIDLNLRNYNFLSYSIL